MRGDERGRGGGGGSWAKLAGNSRFIGAGGGGGMKKISKKNFKIFHKSLTPMFD